MAWNTQIPRFFKREIQMVSFSTQQGSHIMTTLLTVVIRYFIKSRFFCVG